MNHMFLALPIADDVVADSEMSYLRIVGGNMPQKQFRELLSNLVRAMEILGYEEHVVYYDHQRFRDLFELCVTTSEDGQWPDATMLLNFANTMMRLPDGFPTVVVNGMPQAKGIMCAYVALSTNADVIVDDEALIDAAHTTVVDSGGSEVPFEIVECSADALYKWFASNRKPERRYNPGYRKHTKHTKDEHGKVVSAKTYTDGEYESMLRFALGENGHNRKFFIEKKRNRLVIFWDQNEQECYFHVYDVSLDDPSEIQKIYKDGGSALMKMVLKASSLM